MILSIVEMLYLMEIFIGLENKERGQIFSFSFSRKLNLSTSAHFHITVGAMSSSGLKMTNFQNMTNDNKQQKPSDSTDTAIAYSTC